MGCTRLLEWADVVRLLRYEQRASVVRKGLEDPAAAVELLRLLYGKERDVLLFADELLKGIEICRESPNGTLLGRSIYSLMDRNKANMPEQAKTHVVISAMSYERIDMTGSNRLILDLYMAPLFGRVGADVAIHLLKKFEGVPGNQEDDSNLHFESDLQSYARFICALSGGHARVLVNTVKTLCDQTTANTFLDLKERTAIFNVMKRSDVLPSPAGSDEHVMLNHILSPRVWKAPADLLNLTIPTANGERLASNLIHQGVVAPSPFCDGIVLDVIPLKFLDRRKRTSISTPGSVLSLLDSLLQPKDGRASTYGERVSAFFTAYALSSMPETLLDDILPTANAQLKQCTGVSWSFNSSRFDASRVDLHDLEWFEKPIVDEYGDKIKDPWCKLCQHFKSTVMGLPRSSDHWKARLILAPPNCPAIDYVVHFYMRCNDANDSAADVVFGVQVKTAFSDADAAATILSKVKKSNDFLADHQAGLGFNVSLCFHVGNTLNQSELAAMPAEVQIVTGKEFGQHFLPSLTGLLSIDDSS